MEKTRVAVVDDSPFAVAIIREIFEQNGFEVVGSAGTLEGVKELVSAEKPVLVTMDVSMPGTSGFECVRAIHAIDPAIKVVMVSSMKDEEIEHQAILHKVAGFVQKPIDADELLNVVKEAVYSGELYNSLQEEYFEIFKDSLKSGIYTMAKSEITYEDEHLSNEGYTSEGMIIDVGIVGKIPGKVVFSLSGETAKTLSASILGRDPDNEDEVTFVVSELANIVSGNACSTLNKKNKDYGLRVTPPSVLISPNMVISTPSYPTYTAIVCTGFGKLLFNVGFKRGE